MQVGMSEVWDVIVIGAGPAGVSAAIQLHRCDLEVLVLEARRVGGLLHEANLIENCPGTGAIRGPELAGRLEAQMKATGVPVRFERVVRLERVRPEPRRLDTAEAGVNTGAPSILSPTRIGLAFGLNCRVRQQALHPVFILKRR